MFIPERIEIHDPMADLRVELRCPHRRDYLYGTAIVMWVNDEARYTFQVTAEGSIITHEHLVSHLTKEIWDRLIDLGLAREEDVDGRRLFESSVSFLIGG